MSELNRVGDAVAKREPRKRTTGWVKPEVAEADQQIIGTYRCGYCNHLYNTLATQTVASVEAGLKEDFSVTVEELMDRDIPVEILCGGCYRKLQPEISGKV